MGKMGNIRNDLKVISFAIPVKLKKYVDKMAELEGFENISDFLRKILLDYMDKKGGIPLEDYLEVINELQKIKMNRK